MREDEQRISFRIKKILNSKGKEIKSAKKNSIVIIPLEKPVEVKKGDLIFKIQSIKSKIKLKDEESVKKFLKTFKPLIPVKLKGYFNEGRLIFEYKNFEIEFPVNYYHAEKSKLTSEILYKYFKPKFEKQNLKLNLEFTPVDIIIPQKELKKIGENLAEKVKKIEQNYEIEPEIELKEIIKIPPERYYFFKMQSIYDILLFPDNTKDSIIIPIHQHIEEILEKYSKKFETLKDNIIFYIDDILTEDKVDFYRKKIEFLKENGFYKFYLTSKGELEIFNEDRNHFLIASENFHVTNTITMEFLKELGFSKVVLDIENDENNLRKLFFKLDTIVPLFSYVKLMRSRIPNTIERSSILLDNRKKEKFFYKVKKDYFELIHTEPFSIANHIESLYNMGYRNFLFDISNYLKYKHNFKGLIRNFKAGESPVKGRDFNYSHGLE